MRIYNRSAHRNKTLVIRLLREKNNRSIHLILSKKRSKGTSRLNSFGVFGQQRYFTLLKINLLKIYWFLAHKEAYISTEALEILNISLPFFQKTKRTLASKTLFSRIAHR